MKHRFISLRTPPLSVKIRVHLWQDFLDRAGANSGADPILPFQDASPLERIFEDANLPGFKALDAGRPRLTGFCIQTSARKIEGPVRRLSWIARWLMANA